jgi:hypothetical protein
MNQPTLFDYIPRPKRFTSRQSLDAISTKVDGLHARIMLHIDRAGLEGCTNSELRQAIGNVENGTMSARLRELFIAGRIQDSGLTRDGLSGRKQMVWIKR